MTRARAKSMSTSDPEVTEMCVRIFDRATLPLKCGVPPSDFRHQESEYFILFLNGRERFFLHLKTTLRLFSNCCVVDGPRFNQCRLQSSRKFELKSMRRCERNKKHVLARGWSESRKKVSEPRQKR